MKRKQSSQSYVLKTMRAHANIELNLVKTVRNSLLFFRALRKAVMITA